jgi:hypothetical protein
LSVRRFCKARKDLCDKELALGMTNASSLLAFAVEALVSTVAIARNASKDIPPSPIVELVTRKPWLLANLYSGRIPHHEEVICTKD